MVNIFAKWDLLLLFWLSSLKILCLQNFYNLCYNKTDIYIGNTFCINNLQAFHLPVLSILSVHLKIWYVLKDAEVLLIFVSQAEVHRMKETRQDQLECWRAFCGFEQGELHLILPLSSHISLLKAMCNGKVIQRKCRVKFLFSLNLIP